jgi:hypothetical protein
VAPVIVHVSFSSRLDRYAPHFLAGEAFFAGAFFAAGSWSADATLLGSLEDEPLALIDVHAVSDLM